ncbi:MAG: iron complex outermembrane receptor protein [Maribacter sp.]|jgi:iron complex outermembrane receptor protein
MKKSSTIIIWILPLLLFSISLTAQIEVKGIVFDVENNEPLIGANIIIEGTSEGTVSDWDGTFIFTTDKPLPFNIEVSYLSFITKMVEVNSNKRLEITLDGESVEMGVVEVKASRISDKQKESPLTVEAMDIIAIKETASADFYDGLGALKGVDLTAASLGFKVINTRGFNSTSPVRSLQIIDGVDNQAPGLNFSLGNFLGSSELDINKMEIIVGASSAFYGPNAFNGVISMETKDPFYKNGLSAMIKVAERQQVKGAVRWAQAVENKEGNKFFAYKVNVEYFRANDWVADNYGPITDSEVGLGNPGRFDAVNIYGDEYQRGYDFTDQPLTSFPGLGAFSRTGYKESDLVDYNTQNFKANVGLNFRLNPAKKEQSPELVIGTNYGSGTTVYQGDNRFSLKGITFLQNTLELSKRNKYFVRAYSTRTGAGKSYDPYFTALQLQERSKENVDWGRDYLDYWVNTVQPQINESGYPQLEVIVDPITYEVITNFDTDGANQWLSDNQGQIISWHTEAENYANTNTGTSQIQVPFFEPGTERFDEAFNDITSKLRSNEEGGTRFFDNSALYHVHGEYIFTPTWVDKITVGASGRIYTPKSRGTVFSDSLQTEMANPEYKKIISREFGVYAGMEKALFDNKIKAQVTLRTDKNEKFDWLVSPAASIVYTPSKNNFFRASFSSAIRNPTLSDQYLYLDVGRAVLSGNLNGVEDLVTVESLLDFFDGISLDPSKLDTFSIDAVQPERVQTFELGARTTLFNRVYIDAGYYYSIYKDFLGYNIGVDLDYDATTNSILELQPYRYSANSKNRVTTQGLSIGVNYYFVDSYSLNGNYSWNKLIKTAADDPIIPAFNTPEHKFNIGLSGRKIKIKLGKKTIKNIGFNINYKWVEGFIFEGSPQFTGDIPTYDMLDAQINYLISKIDMTIKIGASNILNNQKFQTYGGPEIGRMGYITFTYEPK